MHLHGNLGVYAIKLTETYGIEWVKKLQIDAAQKGNAYTREELNTLITEYN